jgi:glycosyltransferase involved in cell wall biosynthesis
MMSPKISVIIPTNRFDVNLVRAVDSVRHQTFDNIEILVLVNGPSSAELSEQIRSVFSDPRVIIITISTHLINFSLAYGVEYARSEFIARLDSDDFMAPNRLKEQYDFMMANSKCSVVGSFVQLVRSGQLIGVRKYPVNDCEVRKALYVKSPFCHPSIMIRKDVLYKVGSYLGGILAEDYDLYVRLYLFAPEYKFYNISRCLTFYNVDDGEAKRSRRAYVSMISTQTYAFFYSGNLKWFTAIFVNIFKLFFYSNKN